MKVFEICGWFEDNICRGFHAYYYKKINAKYYILERNIFQQEYNRSGPCSIWQEVDCITNIFEYWTIEEIEQQIKDMLDYTIYYADLVPFEMVSGREIDLPMSNIAISKIARYDVPKIREFLCEEKLRELRAYRQIQFNELPPFSIPEGAEEIYQDVFEAFLRGKYNIDDLKLFVTKLPYLLSGKMYMAFGYEDCDGKFWIKGEVTPPSLSEVAETSTYKRSKAMRPFWDRKNYLPENDSIYKRMGENPTRYKLIVFPVSKKIYVNILQYKGVLIATKNK